MQSRCEESKSGIEDRVVGDFVPHPPDGARGVLGGREGVED